MSYPSELQRTFLVALAVWREARGESLIGKIMVAQVIRNRVEDPRWPNTYKEVILQPKQFSAFSAGDPNALLFPDEDDAAWRDAVKAALEVLGGVIPATQANHYHAVTVQPFWADPTKVVCQIGRHVFYRL